MFGQKRIRALEQELETAHQENRVLAAQVEDLTAELAQALSVEHDTPESESTMANELSQTQTSVISEGLELTNKVLELLFEPMSASEGANEEMEQNKKDISTLTQQMSSIAEQSSESLDNVNALKDISSEIRGFTDTIQSISEQTNLLALNAAIEAARAGEQGRGFAVVADEVRTLATKAKESSDQISNLVLRIDERTQIVAQQITGLNTSATQVKESSVLLESSFERTAQNGDQLTHASYLSMTYAHLNATLLELHKWRSQVIATVNDVFATWPGDIMQTGFCQWYYHDTDNDFHFREQKAFIDMDDNVKALQNLADKTRELQSSDESSILQADKQMVQTINTIRNQMEMVQTYLIQQSTK